MCGVIAGSAPGTLGGARPSQAGSQLLGIADQNLDKRATVHVVAVESALACFESDAAGYAALNLTWRRFAARVRWSARGSESARWRRRSVSRRVR